jgi:hypothetical protein
MLRKLKDRINTIVRRCGFAPWFVLLVGCSRCQPLPPPDVEPIPEPVPAPIPEPNPETEPEPAPVNTPSCATACANQRRLGCELGLDTPEGHPCEEVCANLEAGPIASIRWDVECLSNAVGCDGCP